MIDRLVIYLLLAGCLIFGAIVFVGARTRATDDAAIERGSRRDPMPLPPCARQPSTRLDELLATALARPLFSSTRRPPQSAANDGATRLRPR